MGAEIENERVGEQRSVNGSVATKLPRDVVPVAAAAALRHHLDQHLQAAQENENRLVGPVGHLVTGE